jgi:glutathione S-transferase
MTELILHHYDISSFSEKIRLVLGLKALAWRSVIIPAISPKPDLVPLTGGYRRTPVLQIGADIYCDTRLIAAELERRHPAPSLFPQGQRGLTWALGAWAEDQFFWPIARYISGINAEAMEPGFHRDRAAMRGKPAPDLERLQRDAQTRLPIVRLQLSWLEDMLSDGRRFLTGDAAGLIDFTLYHGPWFLDALPRKGGHIVGEFPKLKAWTQRVRAIGHGTRKEMPAAEALELARQAQPVALPPALPIQGDPALGSKVAIRPEDYGVEWVEGELAFADEEQIALRRHDAKVGDVVVHFPRSRYVLKPA